MWEHSEKTHSNWREQVQKALQEGHITTIITFQGTQYMVTLQPLEPSGTGAETGKPHTEAAEAAATPVEAPQRAS